MALDSKQKRGSAISLSSPHRQWLSEPAGSLSVNNRQSLLKLCSAITAASPTASNYAAMIYYQFLGAGAALHV